VDAWSTPDSIADNTRCYRLSIPDDEPSLAAISGALLLLSLSENWVEVGAMLPDDVADRFLEIFDEFMQWRPCMEPGTLFFWAGDEAPAYGLLCDGSEKLVVDYPLLYAVIGDKWGTPSDGNHFVLPDVRGNFLLAASPAHPDQETGGAETHTLSIDEIPAHQHSEITAVNTPTFIGEVPVSLAIAGAGNTGSAGGGGSHNNMPPYLAVPLYIAF
jgi:microcystin-dependent protein